MVWCTKLEVQFQTEKQLDEFMVMLSWMELCGDIGHSTEFKVCLDGDGKARPKFVYEDNMMQRWHKTYKSAMTNAYNKALMDIEKIHGFDIR